MKKNSFLRGLRLTYWSRSFIEYLASKLAMQRFSTTRLMGAPESLKESRRS